ncbi:MAG: alpha/beta hydrolase [Microbacterium sp.]
MGEPRYVDVDGIRTQYYEAGTGPTILLIHGGGFDYRLSIAVDDWEPLFAELATDFHVVAFDKLGAGATDGPADDEGYTMAATIEHAAAFVRALDLHDYIVVGNSRGALPAARLAIDDADGVRAAVLIDSNTLPPIDPNLPKDRYFSEEIVLPDAAQVRKNLENVFSDPESRYAREYLDRKAAWRDAVPPQHPDRPMTVEAVQRVIDLEREVFRPDVDVVRDATMQEIESGALTQPTLVMWAYRDASAPYSLGVDLYRRMAAPNPRTELHVFGAGKHLAHVEFPDRAAAVIRGFLRYYGLAE